VGYCADDATNIDQRIPAFEAAHEAGHKRRWRMTDAALPVDQVDQPARVDGDVVALKRCGRQ
jgi:hypothetical protein